MNNTQPTPTTFPATFVEMPASARGKRAAFYLAAEEYVADHLPEGSYIFTWVVSPTVVMGRNQVASSEVDLDFCRREGIDVVRRKSGGGCIFADRGNVMISLVTGGGAVEPLFAEYAECVAAGLRRLGADVTVSGRNDILLSGHGKICGNAFYHLAHRNIVHGTMLYDTTPHYMFGALKPDAEKLRSAGVKSVSSRIGLLKDVLHIGVDGLERELRSILTRGSVRLDEEDMERIKVIETEYYDPLYLYGRHEQYGLTCSERIEGCGRVSVQLKVDKGRVVDIDLRGDFFDRGGALRAMRDALVGVPLDNRAIAEAIHCHRPYMEIRGLGEEELIRLIRINTD